MPAPVKRLLQQLEFGNPEGITCADILKIDPTERSFIQEWAVKSYGLMLELKNRIPDKFFENELSKKIEQFRSETSISLGLIFIDETLPGSNPFEMNLEPDEVRQVVEETPEVFYVDDAGKPEAWIDENCLKEALAYRTQSKNPFDGG